MICRIKNIYKAVFLRTNKIIFEVGSILAKLKLLIRNTIIPHKIASTLKKFIHFSSIWNL